MQQRRSRAPRRWLCVRVHSAAACKCGFSTPGTWRGDQLLSTLCFAEWVVCLWEWTRFILQTEVAGCLMLHWLIAPGGRCGLMCSTIYLFIYWGLTFSIKRNQCMFEKGWGWLLKLGMETHKRGKKIITVMSVVYFKDNSAERHKQGNPKSRSNPNGQKERTACWGR